MGSDFSRERCAVDVIEYKTKARGKSNSLEMLAKPPGLVNISAMLSTLVLLTLRAPSPCQLVEAEIASRPFAIEKPCISDVLSRLLILCET